MGSDNGAAEDTGRPREAVILAAGLGTRFGAESDIKQLARVGFLGLIDRNVATMVSAGLERLIVVTGHRRDEVESALEAELSIFPVELSFIFNPEFDKKNGISAMLGGEAASAPYLLLMADHVFDSAILRDAMSTAAPKRGGTLYVDRKIAGLFDLDDATKVEVDDNGLITAIGKQLPAFEAVDTGLFVMTADATSRLRRLYEAAGDCSLSEGVQSLADDGLMSTRDIGAARWQDIDTMECLQHALRLFGDAREPQRGQ